MRVEGQGILSSDETRSRREWDSQPGGAEEVPTRGHGPRVPARPSLPCGACGPWEGSVVETPWARGGWRRRPA